MGFIIITVLLCVGSLNLSEIVEAQKGVWFVIPLLPMAVIFFVSALAETNRHPFDLPEAEAELVAGYQVEYSSMTFALFFPRRIREHDFDECAHGHPISRWMVATFRHRTVHLDPGPNLVWTQDSVAVVRFRLDSCNVPTIPL